MLGIYAQSFMTATRSNLVTLEDHPPLNPPARLRWRGPKRRKQLIDPANL